MVDLVYDLWNYWSARVGRGRVMRDGNLELGGADTGMLAKYAEQVSKGDYSREEEDYDDEKNGEKSQQGAPWAQMCPAHRVFRGLCPVSLLPDLISFYIIRLSM